MPARKKQTLKQRFPNVKPSPRTAYQLFGSWVCKEKGLKIGSSAISEEWKLEKEDYDKMNKWRAAAEEDKQRYYNLLKEQHPDVELEDILRIRPKKSCPPFILFSKEEAPKVVAEQGGSYSEALKTVGQRWREMDEEQRRPFVEEAARLKAEFEANA